MDLSKFAKKYRLTLKIDNADGTEVIFGRTGQIYEYDLNLLCVMFIFPKDAKARPRGWHNARTKCLAAGMTLRQNGDAEGSLSFDPENAEQARLAIRIAGAMRKRRLSEQLREEQAAQAAYARKFRDDLIKNGGSGL